MTPIAAIRTCFRKYATFAGRASRSEYWWFFLFVVLTAFVTTMIDHSVSGPDRLNASPVLDELPGGGPISTLAWLLTVVPSLTVGWRRMHDSGRSGLYLLYPLIVMIGIATTVSFVGGIAALESQALDTFAALVLLGSMFILLVSPLLVLWWLTRPSQPGENSYGPSPTEVSR